MLRQQYGGFSISSESDDSQRDPFEEQIEKEDFVVPSPLDLSEDDEEEPSPSQYQVERVRADAADEIDLETSRHGF